jgi:hypothetical protein
MARRLAVHRRAGWDVFNTMLFLRGSDARAVEQAVLHWLREDKRLPPYLASGSGWTETVDADAIDLQALWSEVLHQTERVAQS